MKRRPPMLASLILRGFLAGTKGGFVRAALDDEYDELVARKQFAPDGWYWRQTIGSVVKAAFGKPSARLGKRGGWNHVRVEARGSTIKTWLNGEKRAELVDDMTASGFITLQVHGVGGNEEKMSIRWRKVRIREID